MVKLIQPFAFGESNSPRDGRQPVAKPRRREPIAASEPERPIRVLAIDDDEGILENLAESLSASIFATKTTSSYQTFSQELERFDPDIAIIDLVMPAHDGMDVLKALRDRAYAGEIVVMICQDAPVLETVRRGASSYG